MNEHVIIIGNGVAGINAARFIRKNSEKRITVISAETDHFFSRTALMYIFMGHMTYENTKPYEDWFWQKNRIELVRDHVEAIDVKAKSLKLRSQGELVYDSLVLATGSQSNLFGWPGQDLPGVQALFSYQDLELLEENSRGAKRAVILGGGLIGIELAEMLLSRGIAVTYLVREPQFSTVFLPIQEATMISRHIHEHHIDLRLSTELKEILPDENGRVGAVITSTGEEIPCQLVGLTVGVHPNIDLVKNTSVETARGILVDNRLQTNIEDIYAAGDCAQLRSPKPGRRPTEPVWYTGRMQGKTVAENICGIKSEYDPGIWFNSAKFLDIEYQVYGDIKPQLDASEATLYWEHSEGRRSVRINYTKKSGVVTGFNLMGIRFRHEVCERWIAESRDIRYVLENLGQANFDPEFFHQYEKDIIAAYNQKHPGESVSLKRKKGLFA